MGAIQEIIDSQNNKPIQDQTSLHYLEAYQISTAQQDMTDPCTNSPLQLETGWTDGKVSQTRNVLETPHKKRYMSPR